MTVVAFMSFGFTEILMIGVVALLVFGGDLPDVMRKLGRGYAKFRQGLQDMSMPVRDEVMRAKAGLSQPMEADSPRPSSEAAPVEPADEALDAPAAPQYTPPSGSRPSNAEPRGSIWDNLDEPPPV